MKSGLYLSLLMMGILFLSNLQRASGENLKRKRDSSKRIKSYFARDFQAIGPLEKSRWFSKESKKLCFKNRIIELHRNGTFKGNFHGKGLFRQILGTYSEEDGRLYMSWRVLGRGLGRFATEYIMLQDADRSISSISFDGEIYRTSSCK